MGTEVFAHGNNVGGDALSVVLDRTLSQFSPSALGIASAYVSVYGAAFVRRLQARLGIAEIRLVCDISDAITHPKALQCALEDGWGVRACNPTTGTFHPKIILGGDAFGNDGSMVNPSIFLIGSSNLTYGGLIRNYECNFLATSEDCPTDAGIGYRTLWELGRLVDQRSLDEYETRFAARNRQRSPKDLRTIGVADSGLDPETDPATLRRERAPSQGDRSLSTKSAGAAWAGLESFTGEYTLQVEFPRDAGKVLRQLAGNGAREVIGVLCTDGEIRAMRYRYYVDNGMFRVNIPNDTPGVEWARANRSGIAVLWATGDNDTPLELSIYRPGKMASTVIGRSVALGTWGKTPTRLYGWC